MRAKAIELCLMALLAGCSAQAELEQRVHRYFKMPASQQVGTTTIRSAILNSVSLGASASDVYGYLEHRGIGKDGLSSYYPLNEQGEIVCRVEYNPKTLSVVKKTFGIIFVMGTEGKLRNIKVKEWLTGP